MITLKEFGFPLKGILIDYCRFFQNIIILILSIWLEIWFLSMVVVPNCYRYFQMLCSEFEMVGYVMINSMKSNLDYKSYWSGFCWVFCKDLLFYSNLGYRSYWIGDFSSFFFKSYCHKLVLFCLKQASKKNVVILNRSMNFISHKLSSKHLLNIPYKCFYIIIEDVIQGSSLLIILPIMLIGWWHPIRVLLLNEYLQVLMDFGGTILLLIFHSLGR